jgi:hypothetical protein
MPMTDMTYEERSRAIDAIAWAHDDPEAQQVDLELVMQIRRLVRKRMPLDDEGWNAAWRIAAQLVVKANAQARASATLEALAQGKRPAPAPGQRSRGRLVNVYQEPLVLQAQQELQATPVCR